jgi:hypothetical protein
VAVGREPAHVDADLGDDHRTRFDTRDRAQLFDGGTKGLDVGLLLVDFSNGGLECIDLLEMQAEQNAMLLGDATAQSLTQLCRRCLQAAMSKAGELRRIGLAGKRSSL